MSSSQFPPSSPFLDHHQEEDADPFSSRPTTATAHAISQSKKFVINSPFNKESLVKQSEAYPTPNPSSSAGVRSSSPARQSAAFNSVGVSHSPEAQEASSPQNESVEADQPTVEYKNPLQDVLKAKISSTHTTTLGRSSRCDYFIKSKYASRVHLKLQYDSERNELTVLCKGFNGCVINFGTPVYGYVKQLSNRLFYLQKVGQNDIKSDDEIFNDISLFREEQITVPYLESLTLDIKGHVTVLDVVSDDSETEDELPVLNTRFSSLEPGRVESVERVSLKPVKSNTVEEVDIEEKSIKASETVETKPAEAKLAETKLTETDPTESKPVAVTQDDAKSIETTQEQAKPVEANLVEVKSVDIETDEAKQVDVKAFETSVEKAKEESYKSKSESESSKSRSSSTKKTTPAPPPLQPKSESSLNKQQSQHLQQSSRRRKAEPGNSPQKKKPSIKYQPPREKISQLNIKEIVSTVEDLDTVTNVLINHLAFSRLSQTPLYTLQTVSAVTQNLSRTQLRAVLFQLDCIGTIYRKGKDAAGKPLDEEYYYDPEKDDDFERTKLVGSIKGASGLRNCRKTHKQYFWKKPTK